MTDRRSTSSDDTGQSAETTEAEANLERGDDVVAADERGSDRRDQVTRSGEEGDGIDDEGRDESQQPSRAKSCTHRDDGIDDEGRDERATELAALRRAVEEKYDFEDFGPDEMADITYEEWEAVFDPDTWITGPELLDRVDADLRNRVANRDVFARIERVDAEPASGEPERLLAYSDEGYALVYPDGSVDGRGTVVRDVKPTVALCSMDDYEVPDPPDGELLPEPSAVPEGSGELGNFMLQVIAAIQLLAGVGLLVASVVFDLNIIAPVAGFVFVLAGVFLFLVVANARLSDRFRAEEYRNRLRAVGLESGERPDFLPIEASDAEDDSDSAT